MEPQARKRGWRAGLLASCAAGALLCALPASDACALDVVTKVRPDYARMLFEWDVPMKITPAANGRELSITFDAPAEVPISKLTSGLTPYIVDARQSADKRRVILQMREAYPIRSFISGSSSGVDVLFAGSPKPQKVVDARPQETALATPNPEVAEPVKAASLLTTKPSDASSPATPATTTLPAPTPLMSTKAPAANTLEAQRRALGRQIAAIPVPPSPTPATKPAAPLSTKETPQASAASVLTTKPKLLPQDKAALLTTKAAEAPMPQRKPEAGADEKKQAASATPIKGAPVPAAKPDFSPSANASAVARADKAAEKKNASEAAKDKRLLSAADKEKRREEALKNLAAYDHSKPMVVSVKQERISSKFFFPYHTRTGAASFTYGNDLFVVFSTHRDVDLDRLRSILPRYVSGVEQLPHESATVLRFTMASGTLYPKAIQTRRGYEWVIDVSRRSQLPAKITVPDVVTQPPVKPHVMLDVLQMADAVQVTHPVSGEVMQVIPVYAPGQGIFPERRLPEVTVLRTGQGIAYVARDPSVEALKLRAGLRITRKGGLSVTPGLAEVPEEVILAAEAGSHSFYPYDLWKAEDPKAFFAREQELLQAISAADREKVAELRLKLIQLYLSEGMHLEAQALLGMLRESMPEFYEREQLAALSGLSNFMLGRVAEAQRDFDDPAIKDEDEMRLWHRVMDVTQGGRKAIDYFTYNKQYLRSYPPDVRRRIAILAADNALAQKKYNTVLSIFDQLESDELMEPVRDYGTYMLGRIYAESDKIDEAEETLKPLVENLDNNFLRARAAFTLSTTRYKLGLIDRPTLIAQLEPLRYLWRGDAFELNLLNLLGELYVNDGQYLEGLRAWRDVASYFPDTATAQDASGRMAETFVQLFNRGAADSLTPLQALALYYEFRELTPLGREGDLMVQNLADRLAGVDLLDRAASLLEHQVTFRLEKDERSRVGARLALIYLLNRQPEKTLEVLELTGYGDNDDVLTRERNHLAAMSYARLGKWQRALNLLRDDFSREAKFLRTDIYWDIKDWDKVALTVEDILATRGDITAKLSDDEEQALLRLAIAYTFKAEPDQLRYLRDYFTPLISDKGRAETFAFVTSGIDPVNRDTITRLTEEMGKMKSFLDNYRVSMGKEGLSAVF